MASNEERRVFVDRDGVRTTYDQRAKWIVGLAAAATAVVIVVALAAMLAMRSERSTVAPDTRAEVLERSSPARAVAEQAKDEPAAPPRARTDVRAVHVDRAPASAIEREDGEAAGAGSEAQPELLARDVIPQLLAAGEKEGIAAFPPPGTDPPKSGIVVPEDYELPPGYVRHYQATDDGKRLDAILMFSPDYEFLGPDGRPVPVPANRIVPPEMAPPGLPIRMLELPKEGLAPDRNR